MCVFLKLKCLETIQLVCHWLLCVYVTYEYWWVYKIGGKYSFNTEKTIA